MEGNIAAYRIEDIKEGQRFSFAKTIESAEVESFDALSGDVSPIHMDEGFARARGFRTCVVHGALLAGYLSKMIGVDLPGENCLLQRLDLKFLSPAYIGDMVEVSAVVDQVSPGINAAVLSVTIKNTASRTMLVKGKIQVGFTKERDNK